MVSPGPIARQQRQLTLTIQGLLGVNIPAEVGGVGGSFLEEQIVIEEGAYRFVYLKVYGDIDMVVAYRYSCWSS